MMETPGHAPQRWIEFDAVMVKGHRVASGENKDPRFPGGTIRMQMPFFRALGLELSQFHPATLNVSIAPLGYRILQPKLTFRKVKWHPTEGAEDFSFFDVRLLTEGKVPTEGLIYFPHPETKPEHFQNADVLEVLLPFIEGISVGTKLRLAVSGEQLRMESQTTGVESPG